jgi:hypothetical protein
MLNLSRTESRTPIELSALEKGVSGKLGADLPFDIGSGTDGSYRASYLVFLKAARCYQIDLVGKLDTLLRVEDGSYNPIATNDDVLPPDSLQSRLVFVPAKDDLYRLVATTYAKQTTGDFTMRVREVVPAGPPIVVRGQLGPTDPLDAKGRRFQWHAVDLVADQPYTFLLEGTDFDPRLQLSDATRKKGIVAHEATTPGKHRIARVDLTPNQSGTCSVLATTVRSGAIGSYTLTIQGYRPIPSP